MLVLGMYVIYTGRHFTSLIIVNKMKWDDWSAMTNGPERAWKEVESNSCQLSAELEGKKKQMDSSQTGLI